MSQQVHPDRDRLTAFVTGKLDEDPSLAVEAHVQECAVCAEALEALPASDTLVMLLRSAETMSGATPSGSDADVPTVPPDLRQWSLPPGPSPAPRANPTVPAPLASHARYKVLELLGAGGMGAVYKAEHMRMQRLVALKTISPELVKNPEAVERFNREIRAAAKLSHANIVTAHDADQAGDLHFLVMELAEGETLARHVARHGPMPIAEACDAIRQAALGLQHAHERGMVHRDIKPQNLILSRPREPSGALASGDLPEHEAAGTAGPARLAGPTVKILDFGLARFVQETSSAGRTEVGAVMGTPDYMAPEQALDTRQADIRADIYSLGCTLFFLLTGQPPFAGATTMETLLRHQSVTPRRLRELRPDAPRELEGILTKLLAKRPEERYQTPAAVADALAPWCRRPAPLPAPSTPKNPRRRPWLIAAALGGAAALVCGIVIVIQTRDGNITYDTKDKDAKVIVNGQQVHPAPKTGGEPRVGVEPKAAGDKANPEPRVPAVATPAAGGTGAVGAGTGKGVWEMQQSGVKDRLKDVAFVDENIGVIVGENSVMLRTIDGGKNWRPIATAPADARKVHFGRVLFSGREGWAISSILGAIYHSTDAGETWQRVAGPNANLSGTGSARHSAVGTTYFLQCGTYLYRTSDGGRTWQEVTREFPGASLDGADLFFLDANRGWFARMFGIPGRCEVSSTTDGGKTWKTMPMKDQKDVRGNYVSTVFHDEKHGWLLPHFGTIHTTSDAGVTWKAENLGHVRTSDLLRVRFLSPQVGHVLCAHYPGEVRRTADGGKTWQSLGKLKNTDHLNNMAFPSVRRGWVVGEHGYIEHYREE